MQYKPLSAPVTIIQGTKDDVVDWRHNIPVLEEKIPGVTIIYITNARHQLMNEAEPYLSQFFAALGKQLRLE
jgi:alpha-beta hydrolase superfamily lysophospholipase